MKEGSVSEEGTEGRFEIMDATKVVCRKVLKLRVSVNVDVHQ